MVTKSKIIILLILFAIVTGYMINMTEDIIPLNVSEKSESISWNIRLAESEILRRDNSLEYGGSNPQAKWNYQTGLFLISLMDLWQFTGDQKYFDFSKKVIDSFLNKDGTIKTYKMQDYNIDKLNSGKVLLRLFRATGDKKYKLAAATLQEQLITHPRTKEGGFWHKERYPWQMWLDGIYMGSPFYAEYSMLFNNPQGFDDVANQITIIDVHTRDPKTKLRYHAWDESFEQKWVNPKTGCSPNFWGRAMGWYAMALIDLLDFFPQDHPKRDKIVFILNDLYKAIAKYQDPKSGLWYQVVDLPDKKGNYLEASASSMFVYAMAKAFNKDIINSSFIPVIKKGYTGLIDHLIKTDSSGSVHLTQVCSVAGLGGDPYRDGSFEYYISEPVVKDDLKGVGPFIMASIEVNKLNDKTN